MEEIHLQAMRNVIEKEKDIFITKRFGVLPLSLVDNPNNTVSMLKSIKIRDQKMSSNNMLWIMDFQRKNSIRSLLISESRSLQSASEILLKNTELL